MHAHGNEKILRKQIANTVQKKHLDFSEISDFEDLFGVLNETLANSH